MTMMMTHAALHGSSAATCATTRVGRGTLAVVVVVVVVVVVT
jgi:hypothetical protein